MCRRQYGLDPAHYNTSPGLPCDALLKKTGVELELLTDYDQHLFIEKGMRGGISMISKRHAKANNYLVDGYNPEYPISYILYLDANNLYGWAMGQPYLFSFSLSQGDGPIWTEILSQRAVKHKTTNQPTTNERLPVGRRLRAAGQNYYRSSSRRSRGLFTRGRPGVPRRPTQREQCISAVTRAHGGLEKMDVRVSAQPPGRWGGADRG